MKYLFLVFSFLCASSLSFGTIYVSDALTITVSKPTTSPISGYSWSSAVIYPANPSFAVSTMSVGGGSASSQSVSVPAVTSSSGISTPFYVVVFAYSGGIYNYGSGFFARWISSHPSGSGTSVNGPYSGNVAMDTSGGIVSDPSTGVSSPPTDYEQSITIVGQANVATAYQVTATGASGNVLGDQVYQLNPNGSRVIVYKFNQPFTLNAYQMAPASVYDSSGKPSTVWVKTSATPTQTIAAGATANPAQTTMQAVVTSDVITPTSSTAASQQAQILQGNDEITGAINNSSNIQSGIASKMDSLNQSALTIATGVNSSNAQLGSVNSALTTTNSSLASIKSTIDTTNSSLASINGTAGTTTSAVNATTAAVNSVNTSIGATNTTLGTISSGISSANGSLGTISTGVNALGTGMGSLNGAATTANGFLGSIAGKLDTIIGNMGGGTVDTPDDTSSTVPDGPATTWVNAIGGRVTAIRTSLTGLQSALGLNTFVGSAPLRWNIPLPMGHIDLDLEDFAGGWLDQARQFELFALSVFFALTSIKVIREAFI